MNAIVLVYVKIDFDRFDNDKWISFIGRLFDKQMQLHFSCFSSYNLFVLFGPLC
jgi:hypothetical protein